MCSTVWMSNEDNFWTDIVDPIENFGKFDHENFYEEEIICSCSGRGRSYLIEIPRIPHKYRKRVRVPAVEENSEHVALPTIPVHLNHLSSTSTNKPTRGRGRARQLKHYAQNCQENDPGKQNNNVTIQPFASKNPVPRTLKPTEMFFQKSFSANNWDVSSSESYEGRSFGKIPPSKQETNFDDEFPSLSSQSSSSSTDDLNRLVSGAFKRNKGQQSGIHKPLLSNDVVSETSSEQNLKHLSAEVLSEKDVLLPKFSKSKVTEKSRSENREQNFTSVSPLYWTAEEDTHSDALSTSTISQRENASQSSSLNDIYYSSFTSTDEGDEIIDRTNNCVTPTPLPQKVATEIGSNNTKTWSITGPNVIQLDGLPHGCDLCHLEELIASFGTVQDSEVMFNKDTSSVRFRLDSSDACEWVTSCLHDTDSVFPDFNCTLTCFQVQ